MLSEHCLANLAIYILWSVCLPMACNLTCIVGAFELPHTALIALEQFLVYIRFILIHHTRVMPLCAVVMATSWPAKAMLVAIILLACIITLITNFLVIPSYKANLLDAPTRDEHILQSVISNKPHAARCRKKCRKTCPGRACSCKAEPVLHVMCTGPLPVNDTRKHKKGRLRAAKDKNMNKKTSLGVSFVHLNSRIIGGK